MTPAPISNFMAGLFENVSGDLRVLDPGAGVGSLMAAFVDRICRLNVSPDSVSLVAYEIDRVLADYLRATMGEALSNCAASTIPASGNVYLDDFIQICSEYLRPGLLDHPAVQEMSFTHVIMNPPYGKIRLGSGTSLALSRAGINVPNLYSAFLLFASALLCEEGELVAIVPRSFCNGTYFKKFRSSFFKTMNIKGIHVFNTRNSAFSDDNVLQENVIIHAVKSPVLGTVRISSSDDGSFFFERGSGRWITEDFTEHDVDHSAVVHPDDPERVVHIESTGLDHAVVKQMSNFRASLSDIAVEVSTGPVVDFRLKPELRRMPEIGAVPLLYPTHFRTGTLEWPKQTKKPNAIAVNENSQRWLWRNRGYYVVTKRFTTKEERRRLVASVYSSDLPGDWIGFENHLNVYHCKQNGIDATLAFGLCNYLNSGLLDRYFRIFSGHTQVKRDRSQVNSLSN